MTAGIAGGLIGDSTGSAIASSETGKRAVENNFNLGTLMTDSQVNWQGTAKGQQARSEVEEKARKMLEKEHPIAYKTMEGGYILVNKAGEAVYLTREVVVNVAPFLLGAPELSALMNSGKVLQFVAKNPKLTETAIAGTISTGFDVYNGEVYYEKTLSNYALANILAGKSASQQIAINAIYQGMVSANDKTKSDE